MKSIVLLFLVAVIHQISAGDVFSFANDFETGLQQAQVEGKPMMILFLKNNCGACKRLKSDIEANGRKVQQKAQNFVVVQSIGDTDISRYCLNPNDGAYYPRICFVHPNRFVLNVQSVNAPQWPGYYATADQLLKGMSDALNFF